ncbi:MAG: alanine racemase [Ottowia sp.]|nr:alanine racemase [Ottowia sp.]
MPRPIEAIVHTAALAHNLQRARCAAPDARVWAVVKANAYGHGIERTYDGFRRADGFALLEPGEACRVRQLGWTGPILLLEGAFDAQDLAACVRLQLWHVVHRPEQIAWIAALDTRQTQHVFLKLDSGMSRLGFGPRAYRAAYARLRALPQVASITHMTHFADADRDHGTDRQWALFRETVAGLPGGHCLCNSAATLRQGRELLAPGEWVRVGISNYGSSPDYPVHDAAHWQLQPAMSLRAGLMAVRQVRAGTAVGYGSTFRAERDLRVGTVACGYADGYPRHAGTGTPILVDGVRTRTLGRVSMDMLAVDLDPVPQAGVGSEATLWGASSQGTVLPIDEVAQAAGTVGYELMCALAQRVPTRVER